MPKIRQHYVPKFYLNLFSSLPNRVNIYNIKNIRFIYDAGIKGQCYKKDLYGKDEIIENLKKPGRDPREELPKPILKSDVLKMDDLREGMKLKGTVRNVVDFGAFVDIGVKKDGLLHISQIADRYVKNPLDIINVGDVIDVTIIEINIDRGRISLSMKGSSENK